MRVTVFESGKRGIGVAVAVGLLVAVGAPGRARANDADYNFRTFGGSAYVQHGPGPAYGGAYSDYAGNATGIEGRFSASYGEYEAYPGYGRFGGGSSFGSGPLREAGTGRGGSEQHKERSSQNSETSAAKPHKPGAKRLF